MFFLTALEWTVDVANVAFVLAFVMVIVSIDQGRVSKETSNTTENGIKKLIYHKRRIAYIYIHAYVLNTSVTRASR